MSFKEIKEIKEIKWPDKWVRPRPWTEKDQQELERRIDERLRKKRETEIRPEEK
jgi:hypothetical protein